MAWEKTPADAHDDCLGLGHALTMMLAGLGVPWKRQLMLMILASAWPQPWKRHGHGLAICRGNPC